MQCDKLVKNLCELLLLCLWVVDFFLENAILSEHHERG